jgi:hypothetical protein
MAQTIYVEIPESSVDACKKELAMMKNPADGGPTPRPGVISILYSQFPSGELKPGKLTVWYEKRKLAYIVIEYRKATIHVKQEPAAGKFTLMFGDVTRWGSSGSPKSSNYATQSSSSSPKSAKSSNYASQASSGSVSSSSSSLHGSAPLSLDSKPQLEPFTVDSPRPTDWVR